MVLSNAFYYERIQLDTVNERFSGVLTGKEGDANGRGLIVVLTENGMVKDTTGISLLLKWAHTSGTSQGLDDFTALDLTKGEYVITYPAEMNHEGFVKAEVRIIDNGKYVGSRNMKINVEPSVGDDTAAESSNSFTALVSALLQVDSWNTTIDGKVVAWEADMAATKQLYIDTMNDVEATYPQELLSLGQQLEHSMHGAKIYSLSAFPRVIPEANDLGRFNRAISAMDPGGVLNVTDEAFYEIPSVITITKKIHIIGNDTEFRTVTDGLEKMLLFSGVDGIVVSGIRFNQNLKGRTSIHFTGCTNILVEKCYFTGYSKDFSYYQTDSGILLNDCVSVKLIANTWENHGFQYNNATENLNRCITIQGTLSDDVLVIGNIFNKVNQAIVVASGHLTVMGNVFNDVRDNVVYAVGSKSVIFTGNKVDHKWDEAVVISSGKLIVTNNTFKNVPNKTIAINGNVDLIVCTGNTFDSVDIATMSQFIAWRDGSDTVTTLICKDNEFNCPANTNTFEYFSIGNINKLIFKDNKINVATAAYQKIIYFTGTIAKGVIADNSITGTVFTSLAVDVPAAVTDYDLEFNNNRLTSCRGAFSPRIRVNGHVIQFTSGPYILDIPKLQKFFVASMPTSGTFTQGDYAELTTKSVVGTAGSQYVTKGWIRVTTGSAHVLGTDWIQEKVLTGT